MYLKFSPPLVTASGNSDMEQRGDPAVRGMFFKETMRSTPTPTPASAFLR